MEWKEKLPENIRELLGGNEFETDSVGMSRAGVYLFPDRVLKVQPLSGESQNEYEMLLAREVLDGRHWVYRESPAMEFSEEEAQRYDDTLPTMKKKWLPSQEEFYILTYSSIN